ncbi:hypothetical protein [Ostreiculturibacter nitratireducens]|uniref:hypothetical protein n=1 Tax=Ostreiculturibacter nitratireducens TaxID=3075226 RepID=UPI0031B64D5D
MNISRAFLVTGSLYLIVGILLGMYMGGSGNHTLAPVHAHINLLGFTLMTIFGLAYVMVPQLAGSSLAKAHFWLHQAGALILLALLFLMMSGSVAEATVGPVMPVAELAILLGAVTFAINLYRNAA